MTPDDQRHGTHAGHVAGCREQCCRDAAARYERGRQWDRLSGRPRTVPTLGARRRINALQAIGWSAEDLSARLGHSRAWLNMTVNHNRSGVMYRRNFELIDDLYRELCMTFGPSRITASRAAAKGWAPPLAWDDIDDPNEKPGVRKAGRATPMRERTWDSTDHRACGRCGVVREVYISVANPRGDLCRDCLEVEAA